MERVEIAVHRDGRPCREALETRSCPRPHRYESHQPACFAHALGCAAENWRDALLVGAAPVGSPVDWAALMLMEGSVTCYCRTTVPAPAQQLALGLALTVALADPQLAGQLGADSRQMMAAQTPAILSR